MLKKMLVVLAAAAMMACASSPMPVDTAADEAALKADVPKWFADYNAGNADAVASQYADDAVLMPPNGPAATGRAAIAAAVAANIAEAKAAGLTLKNVSNTGIGVSGDLAWMSGTWEAVDATGARVDVGKYLSVHHKVDGTWKYIRDTWNSDNPAMPPAPAEKGK